MSMGIRMYCLQRKLYKKRLKKKPDAKKPYISRNHLIIDNQSYKIEQGNIRIPIGPEKHLFVRLTKYVCECSPGMKANLKYKYHTKSSFSPYLSGGSKQKLISISMSGKPHTIHNRWDEFVSHKN